MTVRMPAAVGGCPASAFETGRRLAILLNQLYGRIFNCLILIQLLSSSLLLGACISLLTNFLLTIFLSASRLAAGRADQASGGGAGSGGRGEGERGLSQDTAVERRGGAAPLRYWGRVPEGRRGARRPGPAGGVRTLPRRLLGAPFLENEDKGFSETPKIGPAKRWLAGIHLRTDILRSEQPKVGAIASRLLPIAHLTFQSRVHPRLVGDGPAVASIAAVHPSRAASRPPRDDGSRSWRFGLMPAIAH